MPIDITNKEEKQIALTGAEIEETLLQAHLSKDAIAKIEGLQVSASEIDNIVNGATLYTTPEQFGQTYDDVSIQAALDSMVNGGVLLLKAGKTYEIKNAIVIPYSNITIIMYGATISLKQYEIHMIISKGFLDSTTRLSNIAIYGGIIDASSYSGTTVKNLRTIFHMIDRLTIRDVKLLSTSGKYMIALADTTNVLIDDLYFDCASDGIHLMGKNYNTIIKNIKGTAGDDLVAVTTLDYSTYAFTEGLVYGLHVENIYGENKTRIVLLGCTKYSIDKVNLVNINQLGTGACVSIGDGGELIENPTIGKVIIDKAYSVGDGILLRHKSIDDISISNTDCRIYITKENNGTVGINNLCVSKSTNTIIAESYTTKLTNVTIKDVNTTNIVLAGVISIATLENVRLLTASKALRLYGTINKIIIKDSSLVITATADQNINIHDQIETMIIDNTYLENGGTGGNLVNLNSSSSIVKNLIFKNNTKATKFRNILQSIYTGSEPITIKILDSLFLNFKRIIEEGVSASIYNIYLQNFIVTNAINEQIRLYNSQTINLYGDTVNLNVSLLSSDCSTNINCYIPDVSLDISKIKKTAKARAYNTNSALSCGAGYVVCNGTTWTNIATGLTY